MEGGHTMWKFWFLVNRVGMQTGQRGKGNVYDNLSFDLGDRRSRVGDQVSHGVVGFINIGSERLCFGEDLGCGLNDIGVGVGGGIIRLLFSDGGLVNKFL
nr:hypothetical protein [Tanacetum cinerariifolium]